MGWLDTIISCVDTKIGSLGTIIGCTEAVFDCTGAVFGCMGAGLGRTGLDSEHLAGYAAYCWLAGWPQGPQGSDYMPIGW